MVIGFAQPEYDIDEDFGSVSQLCVDISNADFLSVSPVPTFSIRAENGTAFCKYKLIRCFSVTTDIMYPCLQSSMLGLIWLIFIIY